MNDNQDHFNVLRKIHSKPKSTQRDLAEELGFSLGKLNYCLKALKKKGLIKMENFGKNPNKINNILDRYNKVVKQDVINASKYLLQNPHLHLHYKIKK